MAPLKVRERAQGGTGGGLGFRVTPLINGIIVISG